MQLWCVREAASLPGRCTASGAILYATIDTQAARVARKSLDVAGHYNRPDIFKLDVDRRVMPPTVFVD